MSTIVPDLPPAPNRGQAPDDFIQTADTWVAALPGFGDALEALSVEAQTNAANAAASKAAALASESAAAASAAAAAASALSAANAPGTASSSTTSLTISLGTKNLTIQAGKTYTPGQFVTVAYTAAPQNYMLCQITSYNDTTGAMVAEAIAVAGSGTYTSWSIGLSAPYINPNDSLVAMATLAFLNL